MRGQHLLTRTMLENASKRREKALPRRMNYFRLRGRQKSAQPDMASTTSGWWIREAKQ
jgi:hypothetical protein